MQKDISNCPAGLPPPCPEQANNQSMNQSINQSSNQSINQSISLKSTDWLIDWTPKPTKKQPKNQPKINQNGSKIGLGGCLGRLLGLLGASWGRLGAKMAPRTKKVEIWRFELRLLGGKLGAKIHPKSFRRPTKKWSFFWLLVGSGFVATWSQLGSNLAAKTLPKSSQVGSKIHQKIDHMGSCWQDVRDSQKPQICWQFYTFNRFLVPWPANLAPKTHPNSIQEPSKIDQRGYRKYDASWHGI